MRNQLYLHIILGALITPAALAITIGSDTAPNRFNTQQTLNTGDRIAGFACLQGGIQLASLTTTATFDSFFPVSGSIQLNGGTLILNRDFILNEGASVVNFGSIQGNGHRVAFSPQSSTVISESGPALACGIIPVTSSGNFAENVATVDWSYDSQFLGVGLPALLTNEVAIFSFNGTMLTQQTAFGGLVSVNALRWHPSQYVFAIGLNGAGVAVYSYNPATFVATLISSDLLLDTITALAWHPTGLYLAVGTTISQQEIFLYPINSNFTLNIAGRVAIDLHSNANVSNNALDWDITGSYLAVGTTHNGASGGDLIILQFTPSLLGATINGSISFGNAVNSVSWNKVASFIIAIGLATTIPLLQILQYNPVGGTFTLATSVTTNLTTEVNSVTWSPNSPCLAIGKDIESSSGEVRSFDYVPTSSTITLSTDVATGFNMNEVRWSPTGNYLAAVGQTEVVTVYVTNSFISNTSNCFVINNLNMFLMGNFTLQNICLQCTGACSINGSGYIFDIQPTASLLVGPNSSLTLENMTLQGLSSTNLRCIDGASIITLQNVLIAMDNTNYTFTTGNLMVNNQTTLSGPGIFSYSSSNTLTINNNSSLICTGGSTFQYASPYATNFVMKNINSQFNLFRTTIQVTGAQGLKLTKGIINSDNSSFIITNTQGLTIGDGVSASNNVFIGIDPAAVLNINGTVINQNV